MYLDFYGFTSFPFSLGCDERFFYESSLHAEALANMMYVVQQRKGMVLITGEVGAGKTFVGKVLRSRLGPGCHAAVMQHPPQSGKQLLATFARSLGIAPALSADRQSLADQVNEQLRGYYRRGRLVALIIDEAQDLTKAALQEVRLLWNWEEDGNRLVQIVLIGQPELREWLQEAKWEPLRQRIALSYHLGNLAEEDAHRYVRHRLAVASVDTPKVSFSPEALHAIHEVSGGVPRLINSLCDNALLVAYARDLYEIRVEIILEVVKDMTCWQVLPGTAAHTDRM